MSDEKIKTRQAVDFLTAIIRASVHSGDCSGL